MNIFIIAEAGVNHNGNLELAMRLVDAAVAAGADAVKFQTFKADNLATRGAARAAYQKNADDRDDSQLAMLKQLELKYEFHFQLREYCRQQGIVFLSTAFDEESLKFLTAELGVDRLKIPSGEICNGPFLLAHALTGLPMLLSTGMASLGEVETALGVLAFGLLQEETPPSPAAFQNAYISRQGQALLKEQVILLHCTSEYPTPMGHANLRAMEVLKQVFGLPAGYSDHTQGWSATLAAAALGARVIEKHFTLDKTLPGPDHAMSLDPEELKNMVTGVREVELALGVARKAPLATEMENRLVSRKSLVAARQIAAGEKFSAENLTFKRPGGGLSPMEYWRLLGKASDRSYAADELIE